MHRFRAAFIVLIVFALTACGEAESSAESLDFDDRAMAEPSMAMAAQEARVVREVPVEVEVIKEVPVEVVVEKMVTAAPAPGKARRRHPHRSRWTPAWSSARSSAPAP